MASNYAHYLFGKRLLPSLPGDVQQCVGRFRRMYDMGLQGPDFFFYHNPFWDTAAGALGHSYHARTGGEFFTAACKAASSEAARAYLYGLLGHYCLDSAVHPFVNKVDASGEAAHVPLEKEFDRYLMAMEGIAAPHEQNLGEKIRLTRGECVTVAAFFPPATPSDVNRSVKFMSLSLSLLSGKHRGRVEGLLKKVKPSLIDHAVPSEPVPGWERLDSELLARFNRALRDYPGLLAQLQAHLSGGAELGEDFSLPFG